MEVPRPNTPDSMLFVFFIRLEFVCQKFYAFLSEQRSSLLLQLSLPVTLGSGVMGISFIQEGSIETELIQKQERRARARLWFSEGDSSGSIVN